MTEARGIRQTELAAAIPARPPLAPAQVGRSSAPRQLTIGLVNNMPAAAQEATARQFRRMLDASGLPSIRLRLFASPPWPKPAVMRPSLHGDPIHSPIEEIFDGGVDGLIVTGTQPVAANLWDEPYWPSMVELLDWAEQGGIPTMLSCLAAHAAVLHRDRIDRVRLPEKCFGVFHETICSVHPILRGVAATLTYPHSRWNDLPERSLVEGGYQVLTRSPAAGVGIFLRKRRSLCVYLQGHLEYEADTLLREYRRDVRRFLAGTSETYPAAPAGYFLPRVEARLARFEADVRQSRSSIEPSGFLDHLCGPASACWHGAAARIARNWLGYVREKD